MKQLTVFLMLMSFFGSTQAQKLSIANIQKSSVMRNSDAIKEGSEVKGYYFFYVSDKIDRKTNEYTLQIMDQSLNKLKELKFQDSKNVSIIESSFNGTDLVFLFYNADDNILDYQVYGADGTKKFSYTKSISRKDEAYLRTNYLVDDEDNNFKGLYPVEGKGFISNIPSRDNKDFTFQISYVGTDAKKQWTYIPAMDGKMFVGDYLGTYKNVVYVEMLKYSGVLDRNPDSYILGLSLENGKLLFQKSTNEGKYNFYPISMSVLNNGKAYLYGEFFEKGGNVMKDKSKGFAFVGIDETGKTVSEKYSSWALDLGKHLGVSGSGKTTLVKHILYPALQKLKGESGDKVGLHKNISGDVDSIALVEMVDQNPIGKSSRSNPVTYVQAWNCIRDLYASHPLSKMRGFQPKHFSFNVDGGRCDACKGEGEKVVEMQFLADVHLTCEVCGGKRFKEEVLEVQFKGKNVYEVLEMSVDEAIEFFKGEKQVINAIKPLSDVGLGYIKLGQSSDTLSGGEAQRVKLATFLGKTKATDKILFIFDEPTTGLHFHDIKKLLASFNALIEQGHSIIVIEHNTDVIKSADWVIDLGPGAGVDGGDLVYAGRQTGLREVKESFTGQYL